MINVHLSLFKKRSRIRFDSKSRAPEAAVHEKVCRYARSSRNENRKGGEKTEEGRVAISAINLVSPRYTGGLCASAVTHFHGVIGRVPREIGV